MIRVLVKPVVFLVKPRLLNSNLLLAKKSSLKFRKFPSQLNMISTLSVLRIMQMLHGNTLNNS